MYELKIDRGVMFSMKNDAKFEKKMTCQFKIDLRNFNLSTQKFLKCTL